MVATPIPFDPFKRVVGVRWPAAVDLDPLSYSQTGDINLTTTELTISAWFLLRPKVNNFGAALLSLGDVQIGLAFDTPATPFRLTSWLDNADVLGALDVETLPGIGAGVWSHIALAMSLVSPNQTARLRLNGVAVPISITGAPTNYTIKRIRIHSNYFTPSGEPESRPDQFMGMADLYIWTQFIDLDSVANREKLYREISVKGVLTRHRVISTVVFGAFGKPAFAYLGGAASFLQNKGTRTNADMITGAGTINSRPPPPAAPT